MALILNWVIAGFCVYAFSRLDAFRNEANFYWRLFFVTFGLSTFFGGLGHLFFQYTGFYGKYPSWTFGSIANAFAAMGMMHFNGISKPKPVAYYLIWIKSIGLCITAIITQKFIFVAVDAILTYVCYTGVYAFILMKRSESAKFLRNMLIGVVVLLPSAFVFILKLDIHQWLNKDDVSHLLMLCCIYYFYIGMKEWGDSQEKLQHV